MSWPDRIARAAAYCLAAEAYLMFVFIVAAFTFMAAKDCVWFCVALLIPIDVMVVVAPFKAGWL